MVWEYGWSFSRSLFIVSVVYSLSCLNRSPSNDYPDGSAESECWTWLLCDCSDTLSSSFHISRWFLSSPPDWYPESNILHSGCKWSLSLTISFEYAGEDQDEVSYDFTFENQPTIVELPKTDLTTGKELVVGKEYSMTETKPADGYVTAESISFTVDHYTP